MKSSKKFDQGSFSPNHHSEWAVLKNPYTDLEAPKGKARIAKIFGKRHSGS
jgi:hypothetical protein